MGKAPHIKNLVGKLEFSEKVLKDTANELAESAVPMPAFGDIGKDLDKEMNAESETDRLKREEAVRLEKEEEERLRLESEEKERLRLEAEEKESQRLAELEKLRLEAEEKEKQEKAAVRIQAQFRSHSQRTLYKEKLIRFQAAAHLFTKVSTTLIISQY